jgi:uncharacterized membrane protein
VWGELLDPPASRAARLAQARIAVRMRRASRIVVAPALAAMAWGLILSWWSDGRTGPTATAQALATTPTVAFTDLVGSGQMFAASWWLSVGLLALISLPVVNVGLTMWENIRLRQWPDVAFAAAILAVIFAGALMAQR